MSLSDAGAGPLDRPRTPHELQQCSWRARREVVTNCHSLPKPEPVCTVPCTGPSYALDPALSFDFERSDSSVLLLPMIYGRDSMSNMAARRAPVSKCQSSPHFDDFDTVSKCQSFGHGGAALCVKFSKKGRHSCQSWSGAVSNFGAPCGPCQSFGRAGAPVSKVSVRLSKFRAPRPCVKVSTVCGPPHVKVSAPCGPHVSKFLRARRLHGRQCPP